MMAFVIAIAMEEGEEIKPPIPVMVEVEHAVAGTCNLIEGTSGRDGFWRDLVDAAETEIVFDEAQY